MQLLNYFEKNGNYGTIKDNFFCTILRKKSNYGIIFGKTVNFEEMKKLFILMTSEVWLYSRLLGHWRNGIHIYVILSSRPLAITHSEDVVVTKSNFQFMSLNSYSSPLFSTPLITFVLNVFHFFTPSEYREPRTRFVCVYLHGFHSVESIRTLQTTSPLRLSQCFF